MKILSVNYPSEETKNGLKDIKMEGLSNVIIIAGKNGSGKSRLLNAIDSLYDSTYLPATANEKRNKVFKFSSDYKAGSKIIKYVPSPINMNDPYALSSNDTEAQDNKASEVGFDAFKEGKVLSIILSCFEEFRDARDPDDSRSQEEKIKKIETWERLCETIEVFLGEKPIIDRTSKVIITLFGQKLGPNLRLSPGQTILLQYAIALFKQNQVLQDVIISMEEPENHLHPRVLLETLNSIVKAIPNGQLWITTHSIHIVAHFLYENNASIWYMEDGMISRAGRNPQEILKGLAGDTEEINKLCDFFSLPDRYAYIKFAYECLHYPEVVMTNADDPQIKLIGEALGSQKEPIRVLDFGAGKGRLIKGLYESIEKIDQEIDYVAYDVYEENAIECKYQIKCAYPNDHEERYFNSVKEMDNLKIKIFDRVIMLNVLHELNPIDTLLPIFHTDSVIMKYLSKDGYLLIVEDHLIPVGEKAYREGFLVFDEESLRILFNINENDNFNSKPCNDREYKDRLIIHFIPKQCIKRVSNQTIFNAVNNVANYALKKIVELRDRKEKNSKYGREHAFWTMQFTNASLINNASSSKTTIPKVDVENSFVELQENTILAHRNTDIRIIETAVENTPVPTAM